MAIRAPGMFGRKREMELTCKVHHLSLHISEPHLHLTGHSHFNLLLIYV